MPGKYADTGLAHLLPVRLPSAAGAAPAVRGESFRIALTAAGREHVITQLNTDPAENLRVWSSIPPIHRRLAVEATPSATVLAYALTQSAPKAGDDADTLRRIRDYQRRNALITAQSVAAGKVLFLAFDRTWRLRYRAGDVYHHKFWGQIMRWATAGKLPSGTDLVKLGSDKARYAPGEPIRIRAKIRNSDLSPVANAQVAVNIYQGENLALRKNLDYLSGIPGLYGATIKELLSGAYRAQLDCPSAEQILASEGVESVETEFAVDPSRSPETLEVAANRELLQRVAELTGGAALPPWQADRVQQYLPPGTYVRSQRHEYVLWNSWPFLLLVFAILTAEWVLRRRNALP